jgi:hypothetical protein
MFYLLLIIPHLLAILGLAWYAYRTGFREDDSAEFGDGSDDGSGGVRPPPPHPVSPRGGPPLPDAVPPRRRIRVGERLSDLHPSPPRRDTEPVDPRREPSRAPSGATAE